jgi:two-component system LytT family response regulator
MSKLATLIVDDEEDGRNSLRNFLAKYCPDVAVVAEAASIAEAVQQIKLHNPKLVFLDINMPGESGFELFSRLPTPTFKTVFVTAHDEWALRAIKHHALDYLLKPIKIAELIAAVNHAKQVTDFDHALQNISNVLKTLHKPSLTEKIHLPVLDGLVYVHISDIVRCEAEGGYTYFHFTNRPKMLVCRLLGSFENILEIHGFVRVHHHHLVNIAHVERYQRGRGGIVYMSDGSEVIVSQRKKDEFLRAIETHHKS